MLASYVLRHGPASDIRYGVRPDPVPDPHEVLVRVLAVAVNPVDTLVRSGRFATSIPFPFVVGRDVVGDVVTVGSQVTGYAPGDRVWTTSLGYDGRQGGAAELVAVPVERLYPLDDRVDPTVAVAAAHPSSTAHLAVAHYGRVRPGDTVLVGGAAGNVGAAITTLCARAGARVVAVAGHRDLEYVRSLGASEVHDYGGDWQRRVRAAHPRGVDVVADTSGRIEADYAVQVLATQGRILVLARGGRREVPLDQLYMKNGSLIGFVMSHASVAQLADAARCVSRGLSEGLLRPRHVEVLPLSRAAQAHQQTEAGHAHGRRLVLVPDRLLDESWVEQSNGARPAATVAS